MVADRANEALPRIYVDSTVVIAAFNKEPTTSAEVHKAIEQTFRRMARGEVQLVTNDTVIRGEVFKGDQKNALRELIASPHFESLQATSEIGNKAAELRESLLPRKLKLPDAQHLATAILSKCDEFWTTDGDLLKWGTQGLFPEITVREPSLDQGVLFVV